MNAIVVHCSHIVTSKSSTIEFVVIIIDWVWEAKSPHGISRWWIHKATMAMNSDLAVQKYIITILIDYYRT